MRVTKHHLTFSDAPHPREEVYRQGNPSAGGAYDTYRISVAEGKEWAHHSILHFPFAGRPDFGLTNESLLAVVLDRLELWQSGPCPCPENDEAIEHLQKALEVLKERAKRRFMANVTGKIEEKEYAPVHTTDSPIPVAATAADANAAIAEAEAAKVVEAAPEVPAAEVEDNSAAPAPEVEAEVEARPSEPEQAGSPSEQVAEATPAVEEPPPPPPPPPPAAPAPRRRAAPPPAQ